MDSKEVGKVDVMTELLTKTTQELEKLDLMLKCLNTIEELQAGRNVKRTWIIAQPDNTYSLANFNNPKTVYIDNIKGNNDVEIVFDNEPVSFLIPAGKGGFVPCQGAKSLSVSNTCHILAINQNVLGGLLNG